MHNLLQSHILKDILKQIFDIISVYAMLRPPMMRVVLFIFFQAEDGIRDYKVTGVQTCALPICTSAGIGQTTVAPPPLRQNETTSIAFGSCNREDRPQPLWTVIGRQKPDVFVWLGDDVYADTDDMNVMHAKYDRQLANPLYRAVRNQVPIIGTWDDHDYGLNNGGREFRERAASQQAHLDFLGEPAHSPRRQQEGLYASYVYGAPGRQIKVILLDTRYHRD